MRPRRTSEFLDENPAPPASSARSTRTTTHRLQVTPSTAQKYLQRNTLSTRNSFDRGVGSVLSASRPNSSVSRGATPLRQSATRCALFATGTNGVGALHNDKKWVQEQTQKITEHLKHAALMGHSAVDFINQTTLRQMSIKNFVSTINYFLQFMAGTRLSIGTNHVENIVSVLQSLQYPYAVNKSWLKTPNTQHSFGNVIVLFSWMLDFVPPADEQDEWLFALEESPDNLAERFVFGWDPEFQQELMKHCAEAFTLWDKQLMAECAEVQQKTCNLFIKKRKGLPNSAALEREIEKSGNDLQSLRKKCKPVSKEKIQQQKQLQVELEKMLEMKNKFINKLDLMEQEKQQLEQENQSNQNEMINLNNQIEDLQQQIKQQVYTVQERDILLNEFRELKLIFVSEKRTKQTLQEKLDKQQCKLSRLKQQLTVEIERFNERIREIHELVQDCEMHNAKLNAITNADLKLPHNVKVNQLKLVTEKLEALNAFIFKEKQKLEQELSEVKQKVEQNNREIKEVLQKDNDFFVKKLTLMRTVFKEQQQKKLDKIEHLNGCFLKLHLETNKHKLACTQIDEENARKAQDLKNMQQKHVQKLNETEKQHNYCMSALDEFYEKYEAQLHENFKELTQLHQYLQGLK